MTVGGTDDEAAQHRATPSAGPAKSYAPLVGPPGFLWEWEM